MRPAVFSSAVYFFFILLCDLAIYLYKIIYLLLMVELARTHPIYNLHMSTWLTRNMPFDIISDSDIDTHSPFYMWKKMKITIKK